MSRRQILEYLVHVWGVREWGRLRELTRAHLAYQGRRRYWGLDPSWVGGKGSETA